MERPNGGDGNSSSANDAALPASSLPAAGSPAHQSVAQLPSSDVLDSSDHSGFIFHLECDTSDMEEEELRDIGENQEKGLPSPIPKLKFSPKFTLTPSTSRKENEESGQPCGLATPNQTPSLAVDCPERPSKLHRTSTSQCESSLSCRLLFSAVNPASLVPSTEENSTDHNFADLPATASSKQCLPPLAQAETAIPLSSSQGCMEDQITPISSPSSSCSECIECSSSSSSSSPAIPCMYSLGSLIVSPARLSSPGREGPEDPSTKVVGNSPSFAAAHDPQETSDESEKSVENSGPLNSPKSLPENAIEEGQATMDPPLDVVKEGVASAARKVNNDSMVSLAPSSTGSVRSNWTVISGISPLPSSDPSHHYRRRHHHHHHHGHHHHHHGHRHYHHHRKHRDEDQDQGQGQGTDNMLTSTPIHQKRVVQAVDVSAVPSNQDAISDPKFILTSQLLFSDSQDSGREEAPDEGKQVENSIRGSSPQ